MHPMIAFLIGNFYALCAVMFVGVINADVRHRHRWHRWPAPVRAALIVLWPLGAMVFFSGELHG